MRDATLRGMNKLEWISSRTREGEEIHLFELAWMFIKLNFLDQLFSGCCVEPS